MRRRSIPACIAIISAIMFVFPDRAWATDALSAAQLNEARERFSQGRKLEDAGRFEEALVAFRQVARVKTTPQVRFHIALCLMHTNQPVAALEEFHTAIFEAGTTAPNVVAEAKQHIATLSDTTPEHQALLGKMLGLAPRLMADLGVTNGYRTVINTGRDGGQEVYHLHMHVMGGPRPWLKG
jgi:thioredoxin-like negative regulator of GroEL